MTSLGSVFRFFFFFGVFELAHSESLDRFRQAFLWTGDKPPPSLVSSYSGENYMYPRLSPLGDTFHLALGP